MELHALQSVLVLGRVELEVERATADSQHVDAAAHRAGELRGGGATLARHLAGELTVCGLVGAGGGDQPFQ
jgi:hypothetical protein